MRRLLSVLTLALFPLAAQAEQIGTVKATVDGAEMTWFLAAKDGESQSFAMKAGGIPAYSIAIWGNTEPEMLAGLKGALLINFTVPASGGIAMGPEIQFLENGYSGLWIALDDETASISLTSFEVTDDSVSVSGHFEATAAFTDDPSTLATDPNRTKTFSGDFEANLPLQ